MGYTKTIWEDGDVISAERLNKMENGIELSGKISTYGLTMNQYNQFNITYDQIMEKINNNELVFYFQKGEGFFNIYLVYSFYSDDEYYGIDMCNIIDNVHYSLWSNTHDGSLQLSENDSVI